MMGMRLSMALCLCAVLGACSKPNLETGVHFPPDLDAGTVENELVTFDRSFDVVIPAKQCFSRGDATLMTPPVDCRDAMELHVEVLPIHAFGSNEESGDYYAVRGYAVAHNASLFSDDHIPVTSPYGERIRRTGWYMSSFGLGFQLLDPTGKAVELGTVSFLVTPEPSTTIGSTTYRKGFSFSLAPSVTIGTAKVEDPGKLPSWKTVGLGNVNIGFNWEDSSTQNLPDQSVVMSTGTEDRSVSFSLLTNNVEKSIGAKAIPAVARSDQRFDFSFVWHVHSGCYCAKDGDFGNMKMSMSVSPVFKSNFQGDYSFIPTGASGKDSDSFISFDSFSHEMVCSETVDLPNMNRIPVGKVRIKNTTRSYLTGISLWRTGEYGAAGDAYSKVKGSYDTNESVVTLTRAGQYDLVYELVNGDTGESRGRFMIPNFAVEADQTRELSTMDATRLAVKE